MDVFSNKTEHGIKKSISLCNDTRCHYIRLSDQNAGVF